MDIVNLVLPVFAIILTGWLAGALGYMPRSLANALIQFVFYIAMPSLVFLTLAQEELATLLDWRFLFAFGGGTLIFFAGVFVLARFGWRQSAGSSAINGALAAMTNTTFVALPVLQALYGDRGVIPAAVATVFVGAVMFPGLVLLLEISARDRSRENNMALLTQQVALNPVLISTVAGLLWSFAGWPLPEPVTAYLGIFGDALTPCALFAIGLGLSVETLRVNFGRAALLSAIKLIVMPLGVYGICLAIGMEGFALLTAVICAAVPTAKTAYILAGMYRVDESLAASTISMSTLFSMVTLVGWPYVLG